MAAVCEVSGLWDQVRTAPYLSREQWRAYNLIILCQLVGLAGTPPVMNSCTVEGLWNQVRGNPPYISEQEFMAENIYLLCQLLGGGGGGGSPLARQVFQGSGPPAGLQTGQNPALAGIYYDTDVGGLVYQWSVSGGGWY